MQLYRNKYPLEQFINAAEHIKTGHSLKDTASKFNIPYGTLKGALVRLGLRTPLYKVKNIKRKVSNNITYFDSIDTEEKAYFLGFIYADGSVSSGNYPDSKVFSFCLQKSDRYILERMLQVFNSTSKIYDRANSSKITLYDFHLCNSLLDIGIKEDKSHLDFNVPKIDSKLFNSFILGYFDGDGCISLSSKSKKVAYIGITCNSQIFLSDVLQILSNNNIYSSIRRVNKPTGPLYVLEIGKRSEQLKFGDFIYKNFKNSLKRKKDKFEKFKFNNHYGITNCKN